jgi:hypothetical protein
VKNRTGEAIMAILGPDKLPVVLKNPSDPMKMEVMSTLGHPTVLVELTDPQLEQAIRVTGDFIATYFPFEEKYAYFYTQPLVSEYNLPQDAYWVKDVKFDPATTQIGDIFGAECTTCSQKIDLLNKTKLIGDITIRDKVLAFNKFGELVESAVQCVKYNVKECFEIVIGKNHNTTSGDHPYLTLRGWVKLASLLPTDYVFILENNLIKLSKIDFIKRIGQRETIDLQVADSNFLSNNFIVHNSFLFCHPGGSKVLTVKGPMLAETLYDKMNTKVITAFNPHKTKMRWNNKKQPVTILRTNKDFLICTPNHPISYNGKFTPAELCELGGKLVNSKDKLCEIIDKQMSYTDGTWSMQNKTGSMYISALGKEFYLSH